MKILSKTLIDFLKALSVGRNDHDCFARKNGLGCKSCPISCDGKRIHRDQEDSGCTQSMFWVIMCNIIKEGFREEDYIPSTFDIKIDEEKAAELEVIRGYGDYKQFKFWYHFFIMVDTATSSDPSMIRELALLSRARPWVKDRWYRFRNGEFVWSMKEGIADLEYYDAIERTFFNVVGDYNDISYYV